MTDLEKDILKQMIADKEADIEKIIKKFDSMTDEDWSRLEQANSVAHVRRFGEYDIPEKWEVEE